jgi:protoporphyrinogen oxidase
VSSVVSGITSGFYLQIERPEVDVSVLESSEVATNKVETELLESVGAGP